MFVGLNPSTANSESDDPTIRNVVSIAKNNGYGSVYMVNCFPLISADPKNLQAYFESNDYEYYQNQNIQYIEVLIIAKSPAVVLAWGNFKEVSNYKALKIWRILNRDHSLLCIGQNKNGSPKHPLYQKANSKLIPFNPG